MNIDNETTNIKYNDREFTYFSLHVISPTRIAMLLLPLHDGIKLKRKYTNDIIDEDCFVKGE